MPDNRTFNGARMEQQPLKFKVTIRDYEPTEGIAATADVRINGILTIRNVKIKRDDYGYTVTMPRTKTLQTGMFKDSVFFADISMKEAFDKAVKEAHQKYLIAHGYIEAPEEDEMEAVEEAAFHESWEEEQDPENTEENEETETEVQEEEAPGIGMA